MDRIRNLSRSVGPALLAVGVLAGWCDSASAQSSPSAFTTGTRYDLMRRVVGTVSPDPDGSGPLHYAATRNTYDAAGRLTKVETGELSTWEPETVAPSSWGSAFTVLQTVTTTYDGLDRKLEDTLAGTGAVQKVTQYSYDVVGRLQCTAVRMNPANYGSLPTSACTQATPAGSDADRITYNSYDPVGQLLTVQDGYATPLVRTYKTYAYTPDGKQQYVTDANGNKAQFEYDGFDRLSKWDFPSPTSPGTVNTADYEQYAYDANDNRTSLRKRDGQTIGYSYDALNRMTFKDIPGGTATDVYYGYDVRGLQLYARFASVTGLGITNLYDAAERRTSTTDTTSGSSRMLSYLWDADGNRIRITHPDGFFFTTDYDGLDRASVIHENGATSALITLNYDSLGRRLSIIRANGTATNFIYDAADRLQTLSHDLVGTASDVTYTFGYNADDQVTARSSSNDSYAWTAGVNANRAYTPNGLNQYITIGAASPTYDPNGNLTFDGSITYTYDTENRVLTSRGGDVGNFTYDPLGRLIQTSGYGGTTQFIYDGDDLVDEASSSGVIGARYVHGPGQNDPLILYSIGSTTNRFYLHANEQGSIAIASGDNGSAALGYSYDEYGVPASSNFGRFQYTGQAWIPELNAYYYKARIYSPTLGRFLQTDPIGYSDQINLYAYVANDPVNSEDSSGDAGQKTNCTGSLTCTETASAGYTLPGGAPVGRALAAVNKALDPVHIAAAGISVLSGESTNSVEGDINSGIAHPFDVLAGLPPIIPGLGVASEAESALAEGDMMLFRRGPYDSKALLSSQSADAEKALGIHGVSVNTSSAARAGQIVRCATCSSVEAAGFRVTQTGRNLGHHTVELPNPVTSEIAKIWNDLFR